MLDKLAKAFPILRREVTDLKAEVDRLKIRPIVKDGKDGLPGASGVDGKDGAPGEQGLRGEKGERGRDGRDGSPGAIGAEGPRGAIGEPGGVGLTGPQGPRGPKGDKGERGAKGDKGERGAKGDKGDAGKDGASITRVDIHKGVLSVWVDGEKREVGKVGSGAQVPSSFTPLDKAIGGGGRGRPGRDASSKNNTVYIESESDFPVQDETTITLEENKLHVLVADVEVTKNILPQAGSSITANSLDSYVLSYNGTGDMFSGVDVDFFISQIMIDCPNAQAYNFSDSVGGLRRFISDNAVVSRCAKFGTFQDMRVVQFVNSEASDTLDGVTLSGTATTLFSISRFGMFINDAAGIGVDLQSTTFTIFEINNLIVFGVPGSIGISGLSNSGNMPVGRRAMVSDCEFIGATPLQNISTNDIRWEFNNNSPLSNSRNAADMFLTGGAETITINTTSVFEEIGVPSAGGVSWGSDIQDRFTVGTDGVITYDGEIDIEVQITGTVTIEKVGGGNNELEVRIAKNWLPGQSGLEKSRAITQNSQPTSVPLTALMPMSNGDNVRVIFANNDATADVIAQVTSIDVVGG